MYKWEHMYIWVYVVMYICIYDKIPRGGNLSYPLLLLGTQEP